MTHQEIHNKVQPGTILYSTGCGMVLKAKFKLTEVHTNYTGERTYYSVLDALPGCNTFTDHGANEWFLTKEEAIQHGISQLKKKISEWESQIRKLEKEK